jgi:hypothetical protein
MNTLLTIIVLTGMGLTVSLEGDSGPPQAPPVQAPPVIRTPAPGTPPGEGASATTPPPVISYARARALAPEHGGIVILIGDVQVPPHEHYYGAPVYRIADGTWPPSVEHGIYHVGRINGVPMWWRSDWPQYVPAPARGVLAPRPFRGPAFDPDHTCNVCGRTQYRVYRTLPDGRHTHRCR